MATTHTPKAAAEFVRFLATPAACHHPFSGGRAGARVVVILRGTRRTRPDLLALRVRALPTSAARSASRLPHGNELVVDDDVRVTRSSDVCLYGGTTDTLPEPVPPALRGVIQSTSVFILHEQRGCVVTVIVNVSPFGLNVAGDTSME